MADNKVTLTFEFSDQSTQEAEFILPDADVAVQEDIYDRTPGVVALPGQFGFGAIFTDTVFFSAENGREEFLAWVRSATPGRYLVRQHTTDSSDYKPILDNKYTQSTDEHRVEFWGIVDIDVREVAQSITHPATPKFVTFYGREEYYPTYGEGQGPAIYQIKITSKTSVNSFFYQWARIFWSTKSLARQLYYSPDWFRAQVGGLVFAAYFGEEDGVGGRKLSRGQIIPGSRLGPACFTTAMYNSDVSNQSGTPYLQVTPPTYRSFNGSYASICSFGVDGTASLNETGAYLILCVRVA